MKKIFLSILVGSALLSSCSSDNDSGIDINPNPTTKEYKVDLQIRSSAFSVNKDPLVKNTQAGVDSEAKAKYYISQLQVIAYKESGEVAKDTLISTTESSSILIDANDPNKNTFALSLKLPAGKYTLAVIGDNAGSIFVPKNFNTDYFDKSTSDVYTNTNRDTYYENTSINVVAADNNQTIQVDPISLQPMWSQVDLTVDDFETAKIPTDAKYVRMVLKNSYYGFSLKTKLAEKILPWIGSFNQSTVSQYIITPIDKSTKSWRYFVAKGSNTNFEISFEFLKMDSNTQGGNPTYALLQTKDVTIDAKYQFENGYNYTINCGLDNIMGSNYSDQSIGITLGKFNPKDTVIEF